MKQLFAWSGLLARLLLNSAYLDGRFAIRGLYRSPALSLAIVVTIGLGIGLNAALFAVVDRVFFQAPRGVVHPDRVRRLVIDQRGVAGRRYTTDQFGVGDLQSLRNAAGTSAQIEGYAVRTNRRIDDGDAEETVAYVTNGFFALAGVQPSRGRFFLPSENTYGAPVSVIVLGHDFWQSRLAADSSVLGRRILIDSAMFTIVGIAPAGFHGMDLGTVAVWAPLASLPAGGEGAWWNHRIAVTRLFARLRPSVNEVELSARLNTQFRWANALGVRLDPDLRVDLAPLLQARGALRYSRQETRNIALLQRLAGVGLIVLLIALTNVASLLLMRAVRRKREIAVRLALGISQSQLLLQLVCESLLLAVVGGGVALFIAWIGGGTLRELLFPDVRWSQSIIDLRLVTATAVVTVAIASGAGLAPFVVVRQKDLMETLKSGGIESGRERSPLRSGLLLTQTTLCTVLMILAGIFTQSLRRASDVDLGYDVDRLITFSFGRSDLNASNAALARIEALPGVASVARSNVDLIGGRITGISFPNGDSIPAISGPTYSFVDSSYSSVLGLRILRGHWFSESDLRTPTVIINRAMAAEYWPGHNPVGECFYVTTIVRGCRRIVGVVEDVRWDLTEPPLKWMYLLAELPAAQCCSFITIRTRAPASPALAAEIRQVTARMPGIDPGRALTPRLVTERHAPIMRPWQLSGEIFAVFAALALAAAAAGIYGLIAYDVAQRSQEFGVRAALGASRRNLLQLVVFDGVRTSLSGVAIGIVMAIVVGRLTAALLFDTQPHDPAALAVSAIILVVVSGAASFVPAWRAASISPTVALKGQG